MTDLPNPNDEIQRRGPEFALGADIDRVWATGVQVFPNPQFTLVVFRDQSLAQDDNGEFVQVMKNVASLVMPTEVAKQFSVALADSLEKTNRGAE